MWSSLKQKNRLVRPLYLQCSFGNFFLPSSSFRLCHSLFPFFNSALTLFSALNFFLHNLCQLARFSQSNIDLWKPLANGRKALLANNSQHCWKLHVVSVCTPCCMLLCVVGRLEPFKLLALFKRMQHCWPAPPNIVVSCCVCLHVALSMLRHDESN